MIDGSKGFAMVAIFACAFARLVVFADSIFARQVGLLNEYQGVGGCRGFPGDSTASLPGVITQ